MPLKGKAKKVMKSMKDQYGDEKAEEVFYATANKQNRVPETWEKKAQALGRKVAQVLDEQLNAWENELQSIAHHANDAEEHATDPIVQEALEDIEQEVIHSARRMPGQAGKPVLDNLREMESEEEGHAEEHGLKTACAQGLEKLAAPWSRLINTAAPVGIGGAVGGGAYAAGTDPMDAALLGVLGGTAGTRGFRHRLRGGDYGQALREARRIQSGRLNPGQSTQWASRRFAPAGNPDIDLPAPRAGGNITGVERRLSPLASDEASNALMKDLVLRKGGLGALLYGSRTLQNLQAGTTGLGGGEFTASMGGEVKDVSPLATGQTRVTFADGTKMVVPAGVELSGLAPGQTISKGQSIGRSRSVGEQLNEAAGGLSGMAGGLSGAAGGLSEAAGSSANLISTLEREAKALTAEGDDQLTIVDHLRNTLRSLSGAAEIGKQKVEDAQIGIPWNKILLGGGGLLAAGGLSYMLYKLLQDEDEPQRKTAGARGDFVAHYLRKGLTKQSEKDRCWKGYEPVPGKERFSEDSCRKVKKALAKRAQYELVADFNERSRREKERPSFLGSLLGGAALGGLGGAALGGGIGAYRGYQDFQQNVQPVYQAMSADYDQATNPMGYNPKTDLPREIFQPKLDQAYEGAGGSPGGAAWKHGLSGAWKPGLVGAGVGAGAGLLRYLLS